MIKEGLIMPCMKLPYTLQYIDALLKHGNFTKAAKDLYISQPYLTQTIKKIEKELGTEIINRKSPQLQLTDAGKIYYQYLETIEEEGDFLNKKISQIYKNSKSCHPDRHIAEFSNVYSAVGFADIYAKSS